MQLFVKPTHRCNMRCTYCYEEDARFERKGDMTLDTVRSIVNRIDPDPYGIVKWNWHGGEATVMGVDWLRSANDIIKSLPCEVEISLQSNCYSVSEELVDLINRDEMSYGISFDGLLHDKSRGDTSSVILKNIAFLHEHGIFPGAILVADNESVNILEENMHYLKSLGIEHASFNWLYTYNKRCGNTITDIGNYTTKLQEFFKSWLYFKDGFDESMSADLIRLVLVDSENVKCSLNYQGCWGKWLGIEPNGDIYPCDSPLGQEWCLGNIDDYELLKDVFQHQLFKDAQSQLVERKAFCKGNCNISSICSGGCLYGNSIIRYGHLRSVNPDYCKVFKPLIEFVYDTLLRIKKSDLDKLNPVFLKKFIQNGDIASFKTRLKRGLFD